MVDIRPAPPAADGTPALLVPVKAVPGARRDQIVGPLGDRLKVRISAPPEEGKANRAICNLIADALGVKRASVRVHAGHASPEKTIRVEGVEAARIVGLWA